MAVVLVGEDPASQVYPEVLENVGYDSSKWHGYAFGMGVERIAMLKYKINDPLGKRKAK